VETGTHLFPHGGQGRLKKKPLIFCRSGEAQGGVAVVREEPGILLQEEGDQVIEVEELWFTGRMKLMFVNAIRVGDYVYGTDGGFGPAFLTALDIKTGEAGWQERGFGRSSLVCADSKLIILDEDGDLVLGRFSPEGFSSLGQVHIFDTISWTVSTVVGTTFYARDREKIVALDVGR
jgi:hypothetical protein